MNMAEISTDAYFWSRYYSAFPQECLRAEEVGRPGLESRICFKSVLDYYLVLLNIIVVPVFHSGLCRAAALFS